MPMVWVLMIAGHALGIYMSQGACDTMNSSRYSGAGECTQMPQAAAQAILGK